MNCAPSVTKVFQRGSHAHWRFSFLSVNSQDFTVKSLRRIVMERMGKIDLKLAIATIVTDSEESDR